MASAVGLKSLLLEKTTLKAYKEEAMCWELLLLQTLHTVYKNSSGDGPHRSTAKHSIHTRVL